MATSKKRTVTCGDFIWSKTYYAFAVKPLR